MQDWTLLTLLAVLVIGDYLYIDGGDVAQSSTPSDRNNDPSAFQDQRIITKVRQIREQGVLM
jgi:hypothetical protein